ncbi:ShlB/FhaC/HecB family hemolysin secretion/activation protein [Maribacter sp. R86514]|uniref:ShlB/FhaC/HecB family hemolysin secretion/activation protein n=1 Tax=Maribacter sp. R86514 TaxID=3093854 RepID=UPI0037CA1AEF
MINRPFQLTDSNYKKSKHIIFVFLLLLFASCATFKEQRNSQELALPFSDEITYSFYIAGGLGNISSASNDKLLNRFQEELNKAPENSTLVFTGDNITAETSNWAVDSTLIQKQLNISDNFKGETIFLPGNNEWKSYKLDKIEKVENYLKDIERENTAVVPNNGCPIDHRVINDDLDLILVDSKWFVSNWSRIEGINSKCTDIVTRRRFMEELEGYIGDGQGKNIVIAMHHPVFTNGTYAGKTTVKDHATPLPLLGTIKNAVMDLGAFDPEHVNSRRYNYLRIAVSALAQANDRITLISGHEESLQLLEGGGIHQIVSGSLGTKSAAKLGPGRITAIGGSIEYNGKYVFGERGFARLDYFKDGSSKVTFITEDNLDSGKIFNVLPKKEPNKEFSSFALNSGKSKKAKILDNPKDYNKSKSYKFLWGERYREFYGQPVEAPIVQLDTLYGGLSVVKEGGGHQSFSLRLEDKNGRQYAMRSLKKSALKFLKFKLPGISYNTEDYQDTWAEKAISDFFTTAHPYMQLVINPLARSVDINHSDTDLFYVPKQDSLKQFNENYGDELYYIERRPSEEQAHYKGYRRTINENSGEVTDYESTTDMLEKIKSDESYWVDEKSLIRARLFDMLIGDWDRHQDQWRWVEYESEDGEKEFMPIPRDRDNAFPRFDGKVIPFINWFVPNSRNWETYDEDIDNVKWLNLSGNKLDRTLLTSYGPEVWVEEAKAIQKGMTDDVIEKAFKRLPKSVQDETSEYIKKSLKQRLTTLTQSAKDYAEYLNKIVAVTGTEKDDIFTMTRMDNGDTKIEIRRNLSDEKNELFYSRTLNDSLTKEVWLYGLGDDDVFVVQGEKNSKTKLRIVGGYGEDTFNIANKKKVKLYDWEHEKINIKNLQPKTLLTDNYKTNTFHFRYFKPNTNILVPTLGFRTDDGLFLGASNTYTQQGIDGGSFRQRHTISANYFFKFKAAELSYSGVYGSVFPGWNFEMDAYFANDRYVSNFFGFGNETINNEDALSRDFYRGRIRTFKASAGLAYYSFRIKGLFESFKVADNADRLFKPTNLEDAIFENQNYGGAELTGYYDRDDAGDFPSKAIYFGFSAGYKINLNNNANKFGYASLKVGIDHKLESKGNLVLSTTAEYKGLFDYNDVYFYHTPSIGGNNGLRGFRDERFTGKSYFYQSSDLKLKLKRYVTAVSPVTIGMYGGFDYGRVWMPNESSNVWHTSQGGGFWISSLKALTFNIGYFNSKESNLIQVGFGLSI